MRLVDHEQARARRQVRQHLIAKARIVEPFGADEQHVDGPALYVRVDLAPLRDIARVDGDRTDAGALGRRNLVAHQREQRAHDHRWPGPSSAQEQRGHEVDRRLTPTRALHDQRALALDHECSDRRPLILSQHGLLARKCAQVSLGLGTQLVHRPTTMPDPPDRRHAIRPLPSSAPRWFITPLSDRLARSCVKRRASLSFAEGEWTNTTRPYSGGFDPHARLQRHRDLAGGLSAHTLALEWLDADGSPHTAVLRRIGSRAHASDALSAAQHFALLQQLHRAGLPVPEPLLLDDTCALLPEPWLLLGYLPGKPLLDPAEPFAFAATLAHQLARIHACGPAAVSGILPRGGRACGAAVGRSRRRRAYPRAVRPSRAAAGAQPSPIAARRFLARQLALAGRCAVRRDRLGGRRLRRSTAGSLDRAPGAVLAVGRGRHAAVHARLLRGVAV